MSLQTDVQTSAVNVGFESSTTGQATHRRTHDDTKDRVEDYGGDLEDDRGLPRLTRVLHLGAGAQHESLKAERGDMHTLR